MNLADKKYYPWLVVAMLWVVALLNYLDRQMLSTMCPFMEIDIAALKDAKQFGYLMAIFLWIYAFMSPVSGMIADRLNRKWLIVISLFVWSGVTFAMSYATNMTELYILRSVMGVSEAFYIPAGLALIADYHQGKTRSLAIGFHTTGIYLGQAFGGFGATIAHHSSWQDTFLLFGVIGMVYSVILIAFLQEKKTYVPDAGEAQSLNAAGKLPLKESLSMAFKGFGVLFSNVAFWVILFYFSAPGLPGWTIKNWLPTLFKDSLGMEMTKAGPLATMSVALASLAGVVIGGYVSDKWAQKNMKGRVYVGAIGLVLTVPALCLLGFADNLVVAVTGAILFGFGFGVFDVNNMPILCQFVPSRYRATGYGLLNLAGISAGALITGEMGKAIQAGYKGTMFIVMIAAVIAAIVFQLAMLKPKTLNMTDELMARK